MLRRLVYAFSFLTIFGTTPAWALDCGGLLASLKSIFAPSRTSYWSAAPELFISEMNGQFLKLAAGEKVFLLDIVSWSADGNPVVLVHTRDEDLKFRASQEEVPSNHIGRPEDNRPMTEITRENPIFGYIYPDPQKEELNIGISDGHHRFVVARKNSLPVYIEISGIRKPNTPLERPDDHHWWMTPGFDF